MPPHLEPVEEVPAEEVDAEIEDLEDGESGLDGESMVDSEYPENMLADALITSNGEVIADVMAGIRDALEKMNKVLYNKLGK